MWTVSSGFSNALKRQMVINLAPVSLSNKKVNFYIPKIDFSEEKCYGKCWQEHFWASRFYFFFGGGGGGYTIFIFIFIYVYPWTPLVYWSLAMALPCYNKLLYSSCKEQSKCAIFLSYYIELTWVLVSRWLGCCHS